MTAPTNTCEDCHFFEVIQDDDDPATEPTIGTCRRFPPRGAPSIDERGYWPIVDLNDWCGEYKVGVAS